MRLATCRHEGITRVALSQDGALGLLSPSLGSLKDILANGVSRAELERRVEKTVPLDAVEFLPPILDPEKIFCVGLNFRDHAAEGGAATDKPPYPSLFVRFPSSQVGHLAPVVAPSISPEFDYEAELAVIIGKPAWRVSEADALDYVAGYSCFAENSVRDYQKHARQITPAKNFRASGAFGPWLTTKDEVGDVREQIMIGRHNGQEVQRASISQQIFSAEEVISYVSRFTCLLPGDVITLGTPSGVGFLRDPPLWLKPGDVFEVEISRVGLLSNPVVAE